jgi:hypothetical protein
MTPPRPTWRWIRRNLRVLLRHQLRGCSPTRSGVANHSTKLVQVGRAYPNLPAPIRN